MRNLGTCLFIASLGTLAAQTPDPRWAVWRDTSATDTTRMIALANALNADYMDAHPDSALEYARQLSSLAVRMDNRKWMAIAERKQAESWYNLQNLPMSLLHQRGYMDLVTQLADTGGIIRAHTSIGAILSEQGDQVAALDHFYTGLRLAEKIVDENSISILTSDLGSTYLDMQDYAKAVEKLKESVVIARRIGEEWGMYNTLNSLGIAYEGLGDTVTARSYFNESIEAVEKTGDKRALAGVLCELGTAEFGRPEQAMGYFRRSAAISDANGYDDYLSSALNNMAIIEIDKGRFSKAWAYSERALSLASKLNEPYYRRTTTYTAYECMKGLGRHKEALALHEAYFAIRDSMMSGDKQRELYRQEFSHSYEKRALTDSLEFAKKEAVRDVEEARQREVLAKHRIALASAGGGILLLIAFGMAVRKGKRRSDALLHNILPEEVATELKAKGYTDARQFENASILFTDFKGFTQLSEQMTPHELVHELNTCFKAFDGIVTKYGIEKIKTIGDAYMCVGGLPDTGSGSPADVVLAALEMQAFMAEYRAARQAAGKPAFEMRVGIHTGPVVAGIVGVKKFQYDIWGDTVNIASRMESSGEAGRVNISGTTYEHVKDVPGLYFTARGRIQAKGKGELEMYFVERA